MPYDLLNFMVGIFSFGVIMNVCVVLPWGSSQGTLLGLTFVVTWSLFLQVSLLFLAGGSNIFMRLALIFIECFSYTLRACTLGIRLFANLLAGHLVHIILSGIQFILLFLLLLMALSVSLVGAFVLAILISLYFQEHLLLISTKYKD